MSAGLALYGLRFGMERGKLASKAEQPVLSRPEYCPLLPPDRRSKEETVSFASVEAGADFRSTVESAGSSFCLAAKASGWGFGVSGAYSRQSESKSKTQRTSRSLTTSASSITYLVQPVKAFRIPRSQMRLSIDAERDARNVRYLDQADKFLKIYGSHISDGTQHIGGILFRVNEIECKEAQSAEEMQAHAASMSSAELSAGYSELVYSVAASVGYRSFNFSGHAGGSQKSRRSA